MSKKASLTITLMSLSIWAGAGHYHDTISVVEKRTAPILTKEQTLTVDVINRETIEKSTSNNIIDLLDGKPGLRKKYDCSVCNTAQIRLLGLNGAYTQVLSNGIPSYSGLGMIYGLEQMSLANVEQVEIIKGVGDVHHGNSAIAGAINVVQRDIPQTPQAFFKVLYGNHLEKNHEAFFSGKVKKTGIQVSASQSSSPMLNMDGSEMNDVAEFERSSFNLRLTQDFTSRFSAFATMSNSAEDRFGGTESSSRKSIGEYQSDSTSFNNWGDTMHRPLIYQEYVQTKRSSYELGVTSNITDILTSETRCSFLEHYQNSYYGPLNLEAKQRIFYIENKFNLLLDEHDILFGILYNYDNFVDDRSIGTHEYHVPAIYLQDTYFPHTDWEIMGGVRYDKHNIHDHLFSPRMGLKYSGLQNVTFKLNGGMGFRTFNLFSENHSATTSDVYELIDNPNLDAEQAFSTIFTTTFSNDRKNRFAFTTDFSIYHTRISDYIQAFYMKQYTSDGRQKVEYRNLGGETVSQGIEATTSIHMPLGFSVDLGVNLFDNYSTEGGEQSKIYFSPKYMALGAVSWHSDRHGINFSVDGNRVGSQLLRPVQFGSKVIKPERGSETYNIFNFKAEKNFKPFTLMFSIDNFTDFYQAQVEPIFYAEGWYFQTTSVYAPVKGRTFYFGLKYNYTFK